MEVGKGLEQCKKGYYKNFKKRLSRQEEIEISRKTVKKLRRELGIAPKPRRRNKKHRKRRERMTQVLWDTSPSLVRHEAPTQVGLAPEALGIHHIFALQTSTNALQSLPTKLPVEVCQLLDGSWRVLL